MFKWLYQRFRKKPYEVSILVPTYDNVEFLEECISSIITSASKCCEYEILIGIDNCKKTLQLVRLKSIFKNKHIKIYFFPKNVGPYIIRNSLASKAKYDNILFFDSDDVMMGNMIQTLMDNFKETELLKFKFYNFHDNKNYKDVQNLSISSMFSQGIFLIKKIKFLSMNGFFGWRCGADTEFFERFENKTKVFNELDIPVYYRRYHDKNITRSPETGIHSKLRAKYGRFILENRINNKWNNPHKLHTFNPNLVII